MEMPVRHRGISAVHRDLFGELQAMELRDLYVHHLRGESSTTFAGRLRMWVRRGLFSDHRDFRMFTHEGHAYVVRVR